MTKSIYFFVSIFVAAVLLGFCAQTISRNVFAWETAQSAQSECGSQHTAKIKTSFTNNERRRSMNVQAKDQQTESSANLGIITAGQTKTGEIETNKESLMDGVVTFFLKWADDRGGSDQRTASYKAISCPVPTPTPTPTPVPTETPTPTPTPSPTPTQTPTPSPTNTPTPTTAPTPTSTPTSTSVPISAVSSSTATAESKTIVYVQVQPTPTPEVLAAVQIKELPKTGAESLSLLGLLFLLPVGIFLRNIR